MLAHPAQVADPVAVPRKPRSLPTCPPDRAELLHALAHLLGVASLAPESQRPVDWHYLSKLQQLASAHAHATPLDSSDDGRKRHDLFETDLLVLDEAETTRHLFHKHRAATDDVLFKKLAGRLPYSREWIALRGRTLKNAYGDNWRTSPEIDSAVSLYCSLLECDPRSDGRFVPKRSPRQIEILFAAFFRRKRRSENFHEYARRRHEQSQDLAARLEARRAEPLRVLALLCEISGVQSRHAPAAAKAVSTLLRHYEQPGISPKRRRS